MPVNELFNHALNTGEAGIGADSFPLGDDGGTPWAHGLIAQTSGGGAFALTSSECTIDADSWNFAPPTGTFPLNYAAVTYPNTTPYDPVEVHVHFKWDDTKANLFNGICYFDNSSGGQLGAQITVTGGQAALRPYRNFSNNSFAASTATNFTKPSAGANTVLVVRGSINGAADLVVTAWVYNEDTDPDLESPLVTVTNTFAGTFAQTSKGQGVSIGSNASATLTSPDITRIVVNGLTAQVTLVSGGDTVQIYSGSGKRTVAYYQDTFTTAPTASITAGLPTGAVVNTGESELTPGDTTSPGWVVIDCTNVTPGTYTVTLQLTDGTDTDTVTFDLVVTDNLSYVANTRRVVAHGTSSIDSAYTDINTAADAIYEVGPNADTYTQYDNAHAALSATADWIAVPTTGSARYHECLNLAIANKAHYVAGGAAYYSSFVSGDPSGSLADVVATYDALWGELTKNGIHCIMVPHQMPDNAGTPVSGSIAAFSQTGSAATVELESGDGATLEAGNGIYITMGDGTKQFAKISSVAGDVVTCEIFDPDNLPEVGLTYAVHDGGKLAWFEDVRAELAKRGDPNAAEFIEDAATGARVWFITRDEIGTELDDVWRWNVASDSFHVAAAGNAAYGEVIAKAVAYVDIERMTASLDPASLTAMVGDAPTTFSLSASLFGDSSLPGGLLVGEFMTGIGTVDPDTGEFDPDEAGTGEVWYRFDYHQAKDPSAAVSIGGGAVAVSAPGCLRRASRYPNKYPRRPAIRAARACKDYTY